MAVVREEISPSCPPLTEQTTFFNAVGVKRVLICFHGLQTSNRHDLSAFKEYFESVKGLTEYEVVLINLYDFNDRKSFSSKRMFQKGEEAVVSFLKKGYICYLLSYSFSAGIVAHIACLHPEIQKIVLVSPTMYVIKTGLLKGYVRLFIKNIRVRKMMKKRHRINRTKSNSPGFFRLAFSIAAAISANRRFLKKLNCKILVLKGGEDELSIPANLAYISKKSSSATVIYKTYPDEDHMMIMMKDRGKKAFIDIISFIFRYKPLDEEEENLS